MSTLLSPRGVQPVISDTSDSSLRREVFRDADGNDFTFGGMPVADA